MQHWWINMATAMTSFVIAALIGVVLVPFLKKIHFGQTILEIGPKWHKSKQGTPIMGGFMFIISSIITTIIGYIIYREKYLDLTSPETTTNALRLLACIAFSVLFSAIGFADDYIKAIKKQNLGLNAKQKMLFQFFLSAAFLLILYLLGDTSTEIDLIFVKLDFGLFYYPIMLLFMIFLTNAVNLTDGVDGLCGTVTLVAMLALTIICSFMKLYEISFFAIAIAGGCLGFLLWNLNPAKCFMGDTGSMFLGGAFVAIGLATHGHMLMVIVGIVYVCEALSVVLQVISFKTTGKRIFKMSPIHHHFEMIGYGEYKIVITFSLVGLVAGVIAVLMII
ncbi:MAG: phospho-N-acetylmuramoyl-pentapeptide-transferase [Clostridiales bacterium]|jgi:phospho-N-acetylmuramoyl-pentapeptide-transferase|nr:phospho-N-acetylmuramoyl-pentapeptide-transferase [Clostridiales bacterium]